ncbi:hypothetical protein BKA56DRAFT_592212 [Ilyonectria sp. MPI-CAGE-AT-0026]|nr:hypothetical protein BKA56DRAFT_592212 [Ilyonectria sp. MPI-CAGE-AT-0026]
MSLELSIEGRCGLCMLNFGVSEKVEQVTFVDDPYTFVKSTCGGNLTRYEPRVRYVQFHAGCLRLTNFRLAQDLVKALQYSTEPSTNEKRRRSDWARRNLTNELFKSSHQNIPHFAAFPPEIWRYVAEDLLSEYLALKAISLWKSCLDDACVTLSKPIWCGFVDFEGKRYLSSLRNSRHNGAKKIYDPSKPVDTLHVAEDHMGVTQLIFSDSSEPPTVKPVPGTWWRTIRPHPYGSIFAKADGIKLHHLDATPCLPDFIYDSIGWPTPTRQLFRFSQFLFKYPPRMTFFTCNDPSTTGYSACSNGGLVTFHAHKSGEDMGFYKAAHSEGASWNYMPMGENETITEIWRLQKWKMSLGIKTSKGRIFIIGARDFDSQFPNIWWLVDTPTQQPSQIYFEDSCKSIETFAFETPEPDCTGRNFFEPKPLIAHFGVNYLEDFFFNSADLEGLCAVMPCKPRGLETPVGMLLLYSDGHRESIGEVRLDCLTAPIKIIPSGSLWLGFELKDGRLPNVAEVSLVPSGRSCQYLQLRCFGRLEWQWSYRQCTVSYRHQHSPPMYRWPY